MNTLLVDHLERLLNALKAHTGLNLDNVLFGAPSPTLTRLLWRLRVAGIDTLLQAIEHHSPIFDELVDEITVHDGRFFDEGSQFDFIREQVIPELISRYSHEHVVRCWSAGCGHGEEAYSLAVALEEAGVGSHSYLIASDISPSALAFASAGRYRRSSLRGQTAAAMASYLTTEGDLKIVSESIRRRVRFNRLNLAQPGYVHDSGPMEKMDLILCRNVLAHCDSAAVAMISRRLFDALAKGGWLLTAATDPPLADYAPFEVVVGSAGLAYRRRADQRTAAASPVKWRQFSPSIDLGADEDWRAVDARSACLLNLRALIENQSPETNAFAERALRLYPTSGELFYLLAGLKLDDGDLVEAAALLRKAIYLDPKHVAAHIAMASLLARVGDVAGAQSMLGKARELVAATADQQIVSAGEPERALPAHTGNDAHS